MRRPVKSNESYRLIPFMSLASLLIPMLLMGAQFVRLGAIDSAMPAICGADCESDATPPEEKLNLSVAITKSGLQVTGNDEALQEEVMLSCPGDTCSQARDYDLGGLQELLVRVKDRHPDESSVIVVPDSRVTYEVLVSVFDAARGDSVSPLFPNPTVAGGVF